MTPLGSPVVPDENRSSTGSSAEHGLRCAGTELARDRNALQGVACRLPGALHVGELAALAAKSPTTNSTTSRPCRAAAARLTSGSSPSATSSFACELSRIAAL